MKKPQIDKAAIIDELGALELELAPFAAKKKRLEKLREIVRSFPELKDLAAEATVVLDGKTHSVEVGMKANKRFIRSLRDVWKKLGVVKFLKLCTITLGDLETELGEEAAQFIDEERTGTRPLSIMSRPKQEAA